MQHHQQVETMKTPLFSSLKRSTRALSLLTTSVIVAGVLMLHSDQAPAGAYIFAGEGNGIDVVTHPVGYTGTGGTLTNNVCIVPGSPNAAAMELPLQNAIRTWNRRRAVTGNLRFAGDNNIPSGQLDWESVALHELGHCIGLAHVNLATESGLDDPERNATKSTDGANNVFTTGVGADGVRGSSDDARGDDVNLHWFNTANNNPFTIASTVDSSTYSRSSGDLPSGHLFAVNADRDVSTLLGVPNTEAVMQQGQFFDEEQRLCVHDGVATLALAETGVDMVAGNADDYDLVLNYQGITSTNCDINVSFNNAQTTFAVCGTEGAFIGASDHVRITSADIFFNTGAAFFFNNVVNNLVWHDKDADGIQDTLEPGLADVLVRLRSTADNSIVATTLTDEFGQYGFSSVADGTYRIQVVRRAGFRYSRQDQGTSDDRDSDVDAATGYSGTVTVASGAFSAAIDAGMTNGLVATVSSLNANGSDDKAVITYDETLQRWVLTVRDSINGALITRNNLTVDYEPLQVHAVDDYDGNGQDEFAILSYRASDNRYVVDIRNGLSGVLIRRAIFDSDYKPVDFIVIPDIDSNGAPEMVVLGVRDTGVIFAQIRDGLTGANLGNVRFNNRVDPIAITSMPSMGGTVAPELVMVGLFDNGTARVRIRDASSGNLLNTFNVNKTYVPVDIVTIDNTTGGSANDVAVLGYRGPLNRSRVEIRDASNGALLRRLRMTNTTRGLFMAVLPDGSDAGTNQEIAVVGNQTFSPTDIRPQIQVFDVLSTTQLNRQPLSATFATLGMSTTGPVNAGSDHEVDVLGVRESDLQQRVQTRDSVTGDVVRNIDYP